MQRAPSTLKAQSLPKLSRIEASSASKASVPQKRIQSDEDVLRWQSSQAYADLTLFVARLCEAAVGRGTRVFVDDAEKAQSDDPVDKVWCLLHELQRWTGDIEPLKTPQRFGNLAFRKWGERLEQRGAALHAQLLPNELKPFATELEAYLQGGFGSWLRLDYGSGHELSFVAWLCILQRIGFFGHDGAEGAEGKVAPPTKTEERLATEIMPKYLEVAWSVQDRYGLEPAGSHGVWGLDDYQFIPYAIGAAQLREQNAYPPLAVISPSHKPETSPMPPLGLLRFTPASSPLPSTSSSLSRTDAPLPGPPFANLYTSSIARIHSLKRGPFHEHSPILHDVATTVPNWVKVHGGMMKMWQAECLNKRPVVQHFPFGQVGFLWPVAVAGDKIPAASVAPIEQRTRANMVPPAMAPTAAPWAKPAQAPTGFPTNAGQTRSVPPMTLSGQGPTTAPWKKAHER